MMAAQPNWIPRLNHCMNLRAVPDLAPIVVGGGGGEVMKW